MPFHCNFRTVGPRVWDRNIFRFSNGNHPSFLVAPNLASEMVLCSEGCASSIQAKFDKF